ncbi:alpha/beta fold hydrolase [Microlunatus antarcticus]|uniref:Pimeloyl-ACP methyl ester carboxylesterase n=1 Tax=Microlunatus antarcticus TaxID=53388 RepID=A0A7W5P5C3_9ACTN|nr:alpha/beta fold hydrolase [Microlunatus antarcticus]MBB3325325.1 pimeloyl-ACP methyl ester carboxylesterase [Microlunatus antarcticus]
MGERLETYGHDGLTFDVRDSGPEGGAVVIALHGFPQTSASWGPVTQHLTAAGVRVLAPDQRGYSRGARPYAVSAYALRSLVGDVLALADAAGAERFDLLGHDWGGAVAWAVAAAHPDRVRTLTVASTPHPRALVAAMLHGQALRSWYIGAFQLPVLPELLLGSPRVAGPLLARMRTPDPAAVLALLADRSTARALLNWYRAAWRPLLGRTATPFPRVRVPTTYVWGALDPALGRWAAEHTGLCVEADYRFVVLEDAGHWIPDERPAELARLVLERLGGSAPDPGDLP